MKRMTKHAQDELNKFKTSTHVTETLGTQWQVLKEAMFENQAPSILNDEFLEDDIDNTTPEQMNQANAVMRSPFNFYGTYLQCSTQARNGHAVNPLRDRYAHNLRRIERELEEANTLVESYSAVNDTLVEKSRRDAEKIEELDKQLAKTQALLEQERERAEEKLN